MENIKKTVNFLIELAGAKTAPRTGWQRIGIKTPESLADHCALSGQIAYILAAMEGANAERAAALALFHDVDELRIGDQNWVGRAYGDLKNQEAGARKDQLDGLPVGPKIMDLQNEAEDCKTKEAQIACDANLLDMAIQAKYYVANGNKKANLWAESVKGAFKTESAKQIFARLDGAEIEDWWMEIPSIKERFKK